MACPITFTINNRKKYLHERTSIASMSDKFASPNRKNTIGFGSITSIKDRKKQSPAKKGKALSLLFSNDTQNTRHNYKNFHPCAHHSHNYKNEKRKKQFLHLLPCVKKELLCQNKASLQLMDGLHLL